MSALMKAHGLSVWLSSDTLCGIRLNRIISILACHYRTNPFPFHLTVVGGLPIAELSAAKQFAIDLGACFAEHDVIVEEVGYVPDDLQKALYLTFEEDDWLATLRATAVRHYPNATLPPFWHGSLQYGQLTEFDRIEGTAYADQFLGANITLTHVELWQTEGPVHDWTCLAQYPLSNKSVLCSPQL